MSLDDRVMSPRELGKLVGLNASTVRALINEGRLAHIQIGLSKKFVTLRNWEDFCKDATVKAAGGTAGSENDLSR